MSREGFQCAGDVHGADADRIADETFPGGGEEVKKSRDFAREILQNSLVDKVTLENALLIVSELATNVIKHAGGGGGSVSFHLALEVRSCCVILSVTDKGAPVGAFRTSPVDRLEFADGDSEGGRGYGIVCRLADKPVEADASGGGHKVTVYLRRVPDI